MHLCNEQLQEVAGEKPETDAPMAYVSLAPRPNRMLPVSHDPGTQECTAGFACPTCWHELDRLRARLDEVERRLRMIAGPPSRSGQARHGGDRPIGRLRTANGDVPWDGLVEPDPGSFELLFIPSRPRLWVQGRPIALERTPTLVRLVAALLRSPGARVSKRLLCEQIWPVPYVPAEADRRLFFALHRLRELIETDRARPRWVLTHGGEGSYSIATATRVCVALSAREILIERLPARLRRIILWLACGHRVTAMLESARAGVSLSTARRDLRQLADRGLVLAGGTGPTAPYQLAQTAGH